ncbi:MAG: DNA-directed RNA polymerase subunit M [Desulfurococcus sp.]|nr:DNA-directed RNA polymerase subunit M [Desulfurococcus sp.]
MVEFCPRCGGPLVPVKKGRKIILKCNRCGYEVEVKDRREHKVKFHVDASKRVSTAQATEAGEARLSQEEREMLREYYEVLLEELAQEEEGTEELD